MGYTYDQLKQMGATPGPSGQGSSVPKQKYTYDDLIKSGAVPGQASQPPEEKSVGGFVSNIIPSGVEAVKGITSAIFHPIQTAKSVGKIGIGGVQKLIPGEQGQEENFDALITFFKDRYGSLDKIKETAYQDPVGFGLDLATVFSGGGAAATKLGIVSKVGALTKTGQVLNKVSDVVNPINQVTKLAGKGLEKVTAGRKIGGKDYVMDNLTELDRLGVDRKDLPIFATSKSPISSTAEAVASKGIGGQKIWDRMNNIYNKMNDSVESLVKGKLDPIIIGRNISTAVDDFKNDFFKQKNELYKEAIIPKPKITAEIPGYENIKTVTLGGEDALFSTWNKQVLPDGKIRYTKPTTPLFSGGEKPMPASTVQTQKLLKNLVENERQALKGYGAKSSSELKTYEGLLKGLSNPNMTTSDVYRTLQKLQDDITYGTKIKTGNNAKLALIREILDSEFITTLNQQRPDLAKALDTANTVYKQGVKKINSAIIQSVEKNIDRPDIIVKDLLPKLESLEDVKLLVDVLGQKNMVDLRRSILDNIFTEARGVGGQNLQPLGVAKQIKKIGEDKLKILLDPDQFQVVQDLDQISKMMARSSKITGGSQTSFNILSTVGGGSVMTAMTLLAMGNVQGAILSLSPLLGTIGAAKFINSSFGRKVLTEGVKLTGGTGRKIQQVAPNIGRKSLFGQQIGNINESQGY